MKPGAWLIALLLSACAAAPEVTPPETTDASRTGAFPLAPYREAAESGHVYRIVPERSRVDIFVQRGGALKRLGHNHIVTAHAIEGYVLAGGAEGSESRADLVVDLTALAVDEAAARSVYGLETELSEDDIRGTAENLQRKVLETDRWPVARISIDAVQRHGDRAQCQATLEVRGSRFTLPVDVLLDISSATLRARGLFALRQTDLGIQPFSVLGGTLSVRDRLEFSFRIEATQVAQVTPLPSG